MLFPHNSVGSCLWSTASNNHGNSLCPSTVDSMAWERAGNKLMQQHLRNFLEHLQRVRPSPMKSSYRWDFMKILLTGEV